MKATVLVLKTNPWKLDNGTEGVSAHFLMDNFRIEKSSIATDIQDVISKCTLPAVFELDLDVQVKTFNNNSTIKYKINGAKFVKEIKIF